MNRTSSPNLIPLGILVELENGNSSRWTPNSTFYMQWCARQEERVPLLLLARLCKLLQIPHLSYRSPPPHQQPLVQAPPLFYLRRPRFESHIISRDRSEVVVVEPANRLLAALHTDRNAVILSTALSLSLRRIATKRQPESQ